MKCEKELRKQISNGINEINNNLIPVKQSLRALKPYLIQIKAGIEVCTEDNLNRKLHIFLPRKSPIQPTIFLVIS